MVDSATSTKKTRNIATIILASLMVVFSIYVLIRVQPEARMLYREGTRSNYGYGVIQAPFWVVCCCPALLVASIMQLLVVIINKKSAIWRLIPIFAFVVLVYVLGWRFVYLLGPQKDVYFQDSFFFGTRFFPSLSNGYIVPFLLMELVLIAMQIIFILQRRKNRALFFMSIVLAAIYAITILCYLAFKVYDGYGGFFGATTEIAFLLLMVVYTIWNYSFLEPKARKVVTSADEGNSMMAYRYFCPSCGARFVDGKKFCDQCGTELSELAQLEAVEQNAYSAQDASSTGIAILGFLIPLAGFIMWVSWNGTMPKKAKSAGKGALIGLITWSVIAVALAVLYFVLFASLFY